MYLLDRKHGKQMLLHKTRQLYYPTHQTSINTLMHTFKHQLAQICSLLHELEITTTGHQKNGSHN